MVTAAKLKLIQHRVSGLSIMIIILTIVVIVVIMIISDEKRKTLVCISRYALLDKGTNYCNLRNLIDGAG